jgi:type IV pilus assembly protein PilY1
MRFRPFRFAFAGNLSRRLLAASACAFAAGAANAEDIDIFTGKPLPGNEPNVLVIIDSSSNWAATFGTVEQFAAAGCPTTDLSKFAAEMCVLKQVVSEFKTDIRMGLMMFAESGENGGYVRWAVRNMGENTSASKANRDGFVEMLTYFVKQGSGTDNSGSNQPYGKVMFEAFKYFGGGTGAPKDRTHFGRTAFAGWTSDSGGDIGARRRDYKGNNSGSPTSATANRAAQRYGADSFTAFSEQSSRDYIPPIVSSCPKNFIIFISNGNPSTGGDAGGTASATQLLTNVGGNTAQITSGGAPIHSSTMDEWARFLNNVDVDPDRDDVQSIITYTVAVYQPTGYRRPNGTIVASLALCPAGETCTPVASNTDQQMINLMRSTATAGGGVYFDGSNLAGIKAAFARMLNEVQAKNSVFVSASLPVSVNTQGTYLNQVYMGMFRPDATGSPRWLGNLKQYKIVQDPVTQTLSLADSTNTVAVNPTSGFISPVAKSFWTSTSDFWKNAPSGTPASGNDLPDGEIVEKGGAAEQVRLLNKTTQDTRRVYTCKPGGCDVGALSFEFTAANLFGEESKFGVTALELPALVNWIRGTDNFVRTPCDPADTLTCTPAWASAEKGPGWNTTVRPSVHGDVLHARPVVLNYTDVGPYIFYGANDGTLRGTKGGRAATDGAESWTFVAPEFYGKFKRLRAGEPLLKFPDTPAGIVPTPQPKDYFFDGAIGSYQADGKAYIFVTARRGARVIYAFNVTNPAAPEFMWKIDPSVDADFAEMGQTWSEPKAFKLRAYADPVIMFGAGYDPAEDTTPAGTRTMGRGVYIANALSGKRIKFFNTSENAGTLASAVPSDVAVIDRDFDALADRAYVGDMTGNIWRMDIDDASAANWKMYKLANLGTDKKFFFRPDVVVSKEYDLVLVGSGDRERPLFGSSADRFYMLKDDQTGKSGAGITIIQTADLVAGSTDSSAAKGWYIDMRPGEKVINAPLSIGGVTYFSTNRPTPDPESCEPNLGEARAYAVDFLTGGAGADRNGDGTKDANDISVKLKGGGLPPSPVGGVVQLDDGRLVDFVIGSGAGGSPIAPERPPRNIPRVRTKIYWNTNSDR